MKALHEELETNFTSFESKLKSLFSDSLEKLEDSKSLYLESYKRISSLESWKAYILENKLSKSSVNFFIECQNDILLSHSLARIGSWRPALQSLRSAIENTLFCLYYKDHPVEYELWEKGRHQLPISEYINYLSKHPKLTRTDENKSGIALLKKEYSVLSRAVHSSSMNFRMTQINDKGFPAIMLPNNMQLKQWIRREKNTIEIINLLLVAMFYEDLQGAKLMNLRKSISISIPRKRYASIKSSFNIRLF